MKSKNTFPVRGYVRPYEAQSRWALAVITFSGITAMLIYLLCKIPDLEPLTIAAHLILLTFSVLSLLVTLRYDKSAARYSITKNEVYSYNLWRRHCVLQDDLVAQVELCMSVGDVNRYDLHAKAPHLVCSDKFYRHDPAISRSYHRKNQVVIRITRKNFPAVQEYLCRMGIISGAVDYDMLVEVLGYEQDVYRKSQNGWQKHVD